MITSATRSATESPSVGVPAFHFRATGDGRDETRNQVGAASFVLGTLTIVGAAPSGEGAITVPPPA